MRPLLSILSILVLSLVGFVFGQAGGKSVMGGNAVMGGGGVTVTPTTVTYASLSAGFGSSDTAVIGSSPTTGSAIVGALFFFNNTVTLSTVCDGTGSGGCTGSSTYTIEPIQANSGGTAFRSYLFFTCNFVGTGGGNVTFTQSGGVDLPYGVLVVETGNTTTGTNCNDGYNYVVNTTTGLSCQTPTVTTTNAHDMLFGASLIINSYSTYTPGTDGQGNAFTNNVNVALAAVVQTINETAAKAYYSAASWTPTSTNNCYVFAVK